MDQRIVRIQQIMRDNLQRELTLRELAQSVNLSVWRLSHIFRSNTGVSPMQYLRQLRMERARYLLETSFLSVKEIADRVRLKDGSHFVRDFKKAYGDPPTRYRLRFRDGHVNEAGHGDKFEHESGTDEEKDGRNANKGQLASATRQSILVLLNLLTYLLADPRGSWFWATG